MTADHVDISLVLPCFAATADAHRSVAALTAYLPSVAPRWEIIVVDDGGNDFEAAPLPAGPAVRLLRHHANAGKGAAVKTGMLAARGAVRVYTDVDMPYDRELIPFMARYVTDNGFHMVIGDRSLPDSIYASDTPLIRRALSAIASRAIGSRVTGGFFDTQCGIKALRGDVADALFPLVRTAGFAFDVEVVYLALKHSLDIKRVPVRLRRNLRSSVRPLRDAALSGWDILRIKGRQLRGAYRDDPLASIVRGELARAYEPFAAGANTARSIVRARQTG